MKSTAFSWKAWPSLRKIGARLSGTLALERAPKLEATLKSTSCGSKSSKLGPIIVARAVHLLRPPQRLLTLRSSQLWASTNQNRARKRHWKSQIRWAKSKFRLQMRVDWGVWPALQPALRPTRLRKSRIHRACFQISGLKLVSCSLSKSSAKCKRLSARHQASPQGPRCLPALREERYLTTHSSRRRSPCRSI